MQKDEPKLPPPDPEPNYPPPPPAAPDPEEPGPDVIDVPLDPPEPQEI